MYMRGTADPSRSSSVSSRPSRPLRRDTGWRSHTRPTQLSSSPARTFRTFKHILIQS